MHIVDFPHSAFYTSPDSEDTLEQSIFNDRTDFLTDVTVAWWSMWKSAGTARYCPREAV